MQIQLETGLRSIGRCRRWVAQCAREQGVPPDATGVLELLTSEVVTNAVKYGPPGGAISVSTQRSRDGMRVAVADHSKSLPTIRAAKPSDTGGRGIHLVDMLATDWGVEQQEDDGKVVWFSVAV